MSDNLLVYGDNLDVLRRHVEDESVDLIYLDPPFNSQADYNVLFAEQDGSRAAAQIRAFGDTWRWDQGAIAAYEDGILNGSPQVALALKGLRSILGSNNMMAYLAMMSPRLNELRRVLKPSGSLYLHCDPTASHYLKILMDATLGPRNYVNEIVWHYNTGGATSNRFSRKHDIILFYAKSDTLRAQRFHTQREPFREDSTQHFNLIEPGTNRRMRIRTIGGKDYKYYLDEGRICHDVWEVDALNANAEERLDYPTQKPLALLRRIIAASSDPGDVVLDPFCGCGTAIDAAQELGRSWLGIDITHLAVGLIKRRLFDRYGEAIVDQYKVIGEPTDLASAQALADQDKYQFQYWALGLVNARPAKADEKKGKDGGIDGRLWWSDGQGDMRQHIVSVKGGAVTIDHVRAVESVRNAADATASVVISMKQFTAGMRSFAADCGSYESPWGKHPVMQLFTVADLLKGKRLDMPPSRQVNASFKRAGRASTVAAEELIFDFDAEADTDL